MIQPRILTAVRPNAGLKVKYRARMSDLIEEMHTSVLYWLQATYRANSPLALDELPAVAMKRKIAKLVRQWQARFDEAAPTIADAYLKGSFKATDSAMRQALKKYQISVEFKMTRRMRNAFQASLAENVGLIKSIPAQYLQRVEGAVMRSYSTGRDLQSLVSDIKELYQQTQRRAVLIARDQSNKATAVVTRTRQKELGIVEAIWLHSAGGKVPRPSHVAANGKRYKVDEGMLIDGVRIFPGELINCRCVSRSVLPI